MINTGQVTGVLYAVFRVDTKKFKTLTEIKAYEKHVEREQETLNADPELTKFNRILIGTSDVFGDAKRYIEGIKLRKNAVIGNNLILTASPEYFKNITDDEKEQWVQRNIKFLKDHYGTNCTYATLHADETTLHIHALIIPRFKDVNKNKYVLASNRYFDGPRKLAEWQDAYSEAMNEFNLNRGIRFSKAKHVKIRQFYSLIEGKINYNRLNEVLGTVMTHEKVKSDFMEVIEKLNEIKDGINPQNKSDQSKLREIKAIKKSIWELSQLSRQPDKFRDKQLVEQKFQEIREALSYAEGIDFSGVIDNLNYIYKELNQPQPKDFKELYARITEQTLLRNKTLQLQKTLNRYATKDKENEKVKEKIREELEEIRQDKEIYGKVIKTLSQTYFLPQSAILNVINQVRKEVNLESTSKEPERRKG